MELIQHKKPTRVHKYGDILYPFKDWGPNTGTGVKWFSEYKPKDLKGLGFIGTKIIDNFGWKTLQEMGISNALKFSEELKYECEWSDNTYYWAMPLCVYYQDGDFWREQLKDKVPDWNLDYILDKEYHEGRHDTTATSEIEDAFLGHGYSEFGGPSDGSHNLYPAVMQLDNGDKLLVKVWVWFNK